MGNDVLGPFECDDWDEQMVRDFSAGGRGMALVEKVRREVVVGETLSLEEGLARARALRGQGR